MPIRLSLLVVLLLSAQMLAAGAAHGAPPLPSLHMLAAEEEPLEAEAEEEDETEEEKEEGGEESEGEVSAPHGPQGKGDRNPVGHRTHPHKKACRKPAARKRHCKHRDRQDGGFNSRARHPGVR